MLRTRFAVGAIAGIAAVVTFAAANAQTGSAPKSAAKTQLFMLLPYETKAQVAARTGDKQKVYWGTWAAYGKKLADAGVLAGGNALHSPSDARTLRVRNGKPKASEGPYANSNEQITGYLLLNVKSLDEAERWAADCPAVRNGGAVEIRPTQPTMASEMQ